MSKMSLFEIDSQIQSILNSMVDQETGEVFDDALVELENLGIARDEKVENIAMYTKNLLAFADSIKAEREQMYTREATARKHVDRLKKYLDLSLNGQKFETAKCSIGWRKSTSVALKTTEEDFIQWAQTTGNTDFVREKHEVSIAKGEISKYLKSYPEEAECIPAFLIENQNIQIK